MTGLEIKGMKELNEAQLIEVNGGSVAIAISAYSAIVAGITAVFNGGLLDKTLNG